MARGPLITNIKFPWAGSFPSFDRTIVLTCQVNVQCKTQQWYPYYTALLTRRVHSCLLDTVICTSQAVDMNEALRQLPAADVQRMVRLEFFDEQEILTQLLEHYCLSWGTQGNVGNVSQVQ